MLKLKHINVSYGKRVILKDINLEFASGVLYGIVGPNGAGKSTLLNMVSRDLKMDSGGIYLSGQPVYKYSNKEMARKLSYMRQNTSIKFPYTVKELVAMGRYCHDTETHMKKHQIIYEKIRENDLEDFADQPLTTLSGGEVQRAVFAKILAQESDVILVDEGLSNADIFYKVKFFEQLRKEVNKGKLVIIVIHDLFFARKFCDELVVLDKQGVYAFGKSEEVLNRTTLKEVFKVQGDFINHILISE
ncbi:MAG: ABC transporter ATP-binding protein [Clostridium sp.]|uniref:ABC transporter ATP-binding protein n=1 Tax=Clostridium sp. TaxID=1506 RepID=UPI003D6D2CD7